MGLQTAESTGKWLSTHDGARGLARILRATPFNPPLPRFPYIIQLLLLRAARTSNSRPLFVHGIGQITTPSCYLTDRLHPNCTPPSLPQIILLFSEPISLSLSRLCSMFLIFDPAIDELNLNLDLRFYIVSEMQIRMDRDEIWFCLYLHKKYMLDWNRNVDRWKWRGEIKKENVN